MGLFTELRTYKAGGYQAVHKPLLVLLMIGRLHLGAPRLVRFADIEEALRDLIERFGTGPTPAHPEYPFWHLRSDELWEVSGAPPLDVPPARSPTAMMLKEHAGAGGFTESVTALLSSPVRRRGEVDELISQYFAASSHEGLLRATGLFSFLPGLTFDEVQRLGHKTQMGIFKPQGQEYAHSIVTNAGEPHPNYEDHLSPDLILTYHGRGKTRDQALDDYDNAALANNWKKQEPVRVFGGAANDYRDWGRWLVIDVDTTEGVDGFLKLVYTLVPAPDGSASPPVPPGVLNEMTREAVKRLRSVEQQSRYAPELRKLKAAYGSVCQVDAQHELRGRKGPKVIVHHLDPVGMGGQLVTPNHSNELVLCPNCHALFDDGSLFIDPDDGATLRHWAVDPDYDRHPLHFVEGHRLNRELLRRVYRLHYHKSWARSDGPAHNQAPT